MNKDFLLKKTRNIFTASEDEFLLTSSDKKNSPLKLE